MYAKEETNNFIYSCLRGQDGQKEKMERKQYLKPKTDEIYSPLCLMENWSEKPGHWAKPDLTPDDSYDNGASGSSGNEEDNSTLWEE